MKPTLTDAYQQGWDVVKGVVSDFIDEVRYHLRMDNDPYRARNLIIYSIAELEGKVREVSGDE
jgi:hypothetical protein